MLHFQDKHIRKTKVLQYPLLEVEPKYKVYKAEYRQMLSLNDLLRFQTMCTDVQIV